MKNKADRLRALAFEPVSQNEDGMVYGHIVYDIKKLRSVSDDELLQLITDQTIRLYPFAIYVPYIHRFNKLGVAEFPVRLPLSPLLRVAEKKEVCC